MVRFKNLSKFFNNIFSVLGLFHSKNGICAFSRKMTSFRQSENIIVLWVRVRDRGRAVIYVNTFSVKRVFKQ